MNSQKLEQLKFVFGLKSECDVMSFKDMELLKDYIQNYECESNYKYAFLSDGSKEEELYRFSCSIFELKIAFQKAKKTNSFVVKQVSSEEFQLIKNDYEVITVKTI
jgi:hypothetical protein